jgi:hypothetical protein
MNFVTVIRATETNVGKVALFAAVGATVVMPVGIFTSIWFVANHVPIKATTQLFEAALVMVTTLLALYALYLQIYYKYKQKN